jgi:hypothetical protein
MPRFPIWTRFLSRLKKAETAKRTYILDIYKFDYGVKKKPVTAEYRHIL